MNRVAVIGSGPSGVYCTAALLAKQDLSVDVFDQLPSPLGLVRYGVAPDHPKIKSVSVALERVLTDERVRFLGHVQVGRDVTVDELHGYYDSIIFAVGAADRGRRLHIPGEELAGSASGVDFVRWYSGHPDASSRGFRLSAKRAVVVGAGNVALDVARILSKSADELRDTDVPQDVLDEFERSAVTDLHVLIRRGPASTRFTTVELRELGEIAHADVRVDPRDIEPDPPDAPGRSVALRNVRVFREWSQRAALGRPRTIHFHFWRQPTLIVGDGAVSEVVAERTHDRGDGHIVGTGETTRIRAEMVLSCIGYHGTPVAGVPFDDVAGIVPNVDGRVVDDGRVVPGEYVAGWIKRGPTGVIGTNKHDANETVAALLEDLAARDAGAPRSEDDVVALLHERGVQVVTWRGWTRLKDAEARLGESLGRGTVKITDHDELLAAASGDADPGREPAL